MGLQPLEIFYSYNGEIDFSRHNLTSTDFRFCRLKNIVRIYKAYIDGACSQNHTVLFDFINYPFHHRDRLLTEKN